MDAKHKPVPVLMAELRGSVSKTTFKTQYRTQTSRSIELKESMTSHIHVNCIVLGSDESEMRQNGRIGPLKDLHQLKHLRIPHQILVGPEFSGSETGLLGPGRKCPPLKLLEAVPDSLETLYLYSRSGDDDHHIAKEL